MWYHSPSLINDPPTPASVNEIFAWELVPCNEQQASLSIVNCGVSCQCGEFNYSRGDTMTFDFCKSSAVGTEPLPWPDKRGEKSREIPQEGEGFGGCPWDCPSAQGCPEQDIQTEFKQTHLGGSWVYIHFCRAEQFLLQPCF